MLDSSETGSFTEPIALLEGAFALGQRGYDFSPDGGRILILNQDPVVARSLDGEKMAVLCREFGISRKTGYKI